MKYEVQNRITLVDNRWKFKGQIIRGKKLIPVTGSVPNLATNGMIKRAIVKEMEAALKKYKPKPTAPVIKVLSENNIFKDELTVR